MRTGRRRIQQRSPVVSLTCVAVVSAIGLTGLTGATGTARAGNTDPAPSNNSYVQTWTTAPPGHDQQAQEKANFVAYYTNPSYLAETNGDQRNDDLADTLMDIDYDFTRLPTDEFAQLDAAVNAIRTEAAQFPYMLNATGPGINSPDPALAEPLRQDAQWLQSLPSTSAGLIHPDPITQQTEQHIEQSAPKIYHRSRYDHYLSLGHPETEAERLAKFDTDRAVTGTQRSVFTSPEVDMARIYYYQGVEFEHLGRAENTYRSFKNTLLLLRLEQRTVTYSALSRAISGDGPYAAGRWDINGIAFHEPSDLGGPSAGRMAPSPVPPRCAPDNTCPALYMATE